MGLGKLVLDAHVLFWNRNSKSLRRAYIHSWKPLKELSHGIFRHFGHVKALSSFWLSFENWNINWQRFCCTTRRGKQKCSQGVFQRVSKVKVTEYWIQNEVVFRKFAVFFSQTDAIHTLIRSSRPSSMKSFVVYYHSLTIKVVCKPLFGNTKIKI